MLAYERDFIYKIFPELTEAINNLSSKLEQQNNNKITDNTSDESKNKSDSLYLFYKELDKANITVEDFTGHIGCILGLNVLKDPEKDNAAVKEAWKFIEKIYEMAVKCL